MRFCLAWLNVSLKKTLSDKAFFVILVLIPFVGWLVNGQMLKEDNQLEIKVGLYYSENLFIQEMADSLIKSTDIVNYIKYDDYEEMKKDVSAHKIECGYAFDENLQERLRLGESEGIIKCLKSSATLMDAIVNELIFAQFLDLYSDEILYDFIEEKNLEYIIKADKIPQNKERFLKTGSIFDFDYEYIGEEKTSEYTSVKFQLIKSVMALILMVGAVFASIRYKNEDNKGIFLLMNPYKIFTVKFIESASVILPVSVSVIIFACIQAGFFLNVAELLLIIILMIVFSVFLSEIIKDNVVLSVVMVILIIGTIFCSPLVVSFVDKFGAVGWFVKAIPAYYWLNTNNIVLICEIMAFFIAGFLFELHNKNY